jgi:hypothetical protein
MRLAGLPWLDRLGYPGVVAIGLLVCAAVAYGSALRPLTASALAAERQVATAGRAAMAHTNASATANFNPASTITDLLASMPKEAELGAQLGSLHQISRRHSVVLDRGSFERTLDGRGRVARQTMSFQAVASYPALRRFLRDSLEAHAFLALDEVLVTPKAGDFSKLEARLRFSLLFQQAQAGG